MTAVAPQRMLNMLLAQRHMIAPAVDLEIAKRRYLRAYDAPDEAWARWLVELFPRAFITNLDKLVRFAIFHEEFWRHIVSLRAGVRPPAFLGCWSRDTGKSTNAEAACVYLGGEGIRTYGLYVCGTQAQADDHVANVSGMLESRSVAERYPLLAERSLNKFGQSKGWRVNRLRTAAGFTLDAVGLDKAVRGSKLDEDRPNLIILDDIDNEHDSPRTVAKNIETINKAILPAGDRRSVAVLFQQNRIHDNSVMARILDGLEDMLLDRIVSGPHPAIRNLDYAQRAEGGFQITGGEPVWDGLDLQTCQEILNTIGLRAFLAEYQQQKGARRGALWTQEILDQFRVMAAPILRRKVLGIDPAGSSEREGSQTGVVLAGRCEADHGYVLRDYTDYYTPKEWGQLAVKLWREEELDAIVAEANNGGEMVANTILAIDEDAPVVTVKAKRGKWTRAEPVAALYDQGKVHHVGVLGGLESQMKLTYDPDSLESTFDAYDAMVWSLSEMFFGDSDEYPHYNPSRHTYNIPGVAA